MVSKAWKEHEKTVAIKLAGTRLARTDFSKSQPDVVVPGERILSTRYPGTLLVECKYSQNQPWHKLIVNTVSKTTKLSIATCKNLIFWNLDDTIMVVEKFFTPVIKVLTNSIVVVSIEKEIPSYISKMLEQAKGYSGNMTWGPLPHLPMVCIAQKSSKTRICFTTKEDLIDYYDSASGNRQDRLLSQISRDTPLTC